MNLEQLRARLAEISEQRRTIHEAAADRALNDDEQTQWDALDTDEAEVTQRIAEVEQTQARAQRVAESRARWNSLHVGGQHDDNPFDLDAMRGLQGDAIVERARFAFDESRTRGAGAAEVLRKIEDLSDREDGQAADLARYALVHGSQAYRSAFRAWFAASAKGNAPVLTQAEADAVRASMALSSATGGYALPTLLDPTLIRTGTATKNPIRRIARVEQGTQDVWHGVTVAGVTTYWKAEGSPFIDGTPAFGGVSIDAAMLTAYVTGSYEIFADSGLQAQLPDLIGEAIDFAEGTAFVTGSGSNAPKGIVTAISATAGDTVTATTRGSFTSASGVDTLALLNALPSRYEDTATWLMNKAIYRTIQQQVFGTAGVPLIDMTAKDVLLDLPIVRASDMVSTTTSGNVLSVLGDFSQFIIYDRLGVNVEFLPNVVDTNGLPTGQRGLVAYKRVGSDVSDLNAFRFLKA